MAAIIHQTDKRSGITYAYESISYWDKEKKQSRAKRKLIGRVDKKTDEIVPTDGRCRRKKVSGEHSMIEAASALDMGVPSSLGVSPPHIFFKFCIVICTACNLSLTTVFFSLLIATFISSFSTSLNSYFINIFTTF